MRLSGYEMLLRLIFSLVVSVFAMAVAAEDNLPQGLVRMLVQDSPLAGSQFHALNSVWEQIQVGDGLSLEREPENPHDSNAIRVLWQGHHLGYVPRKENRMLAAAMDAKESVDARVTRLVAHRNPWLRLRFAVFVRL